MNITVFYAWQSDRPERLNHFLIRDAAKSACQRITADGDNDWVVKLDHDTQDVPGMCDIPNEILGKIDKCDIFLADLTLIGKTEGGKALPNANVLFELGYAAKTLTFNALVGVINEEYGELASQVFDIKRRKALGYTATKDMTKQELKVTTERLSKTLEGIFRSTIEKVVVERRSGDLLAENNEIKDRQEEIARRVLRGKVEGATNLPAIVTSFLFAPHRQLDYENIGNAVRSQYGKSPEIHTDAYTWDDNACRCEFSLGGYFHRICTKDSSSLKIQRQIEVQAAVPISMNHFRAQPVHGNIIRGVVSTAKLLSISGIKLPWWVTISIVGANGYGMLDDANMASKKTFANDIVHLPPQLVTVSEQVLDGMAAGTTLRRALQHLTRTLGWEFNWYYTENRTFNLRIF